MKLEKEWIFLFVLISLFQFMFNGCSKNGDNFVLIKNENFKTVIDGKVTHLYKLKNSNDMIVKITNYGGKIVQILVPDRNGNLGDVVLGYETY